MMVPWSCPPTFMNPFLCIVELPACRALRWGKGCLAFGSAFVALAIAPKVVHAKSFNRGWSLLACLRGGRSAGGVVKAGCVAVPQPLACRGRAEHLGLPDGLPGRNASSRVPPAPLLHLCRAASV